jgi:hypothetical protein
MDDVWKLESSEQDEAIEYINFWLNMDFRELIDLSLRRPISAVFAN